MNSSVSKSFRFSFAKKLKFAFKSNGAKMDNFLSDSKDYDYQTLFNISVGVLQIYNNYT